MKKTVAAVQTDHGQPSCSARQGDIGDSAPKSSGDSPSFSSFVPLDENTVKDYVLAHPDLAQKLGSNIEEWTAREVGDGKINFVFVIESPQGALVVKQAMPYVRVVGESWPLTQVPS